MDQKRIPTHQNALAITIFVATWHERRDQDRNDANFKVGEEGASKQTRYGQMHSVYCSRVHHEGE